MLKCIKSVVFMNLTLSYFGKLWVFWPGALPLCPGEKLKSDISQETIPAGEEERDNSGTSFLKTSSDKNPLAKSLRSTAQTPLADPLHPSLSLKNASFFHCTLWVGTVGSGGFLICCNGLVLQGRYNPPIYFLSKCNSPNYGDSTLFMRENNKKIPLIKIINVFVHIALFYLFSLHGNILLFALG